MNAFVYITCFNSSLMVYKKMFQIILISFSILSFYHITYFAFIHLKFILHKLHCLAHSMNISMHCLAHSMNISMSGSCTRFPSPLHWSLEMLRPNGIKLTFTFFHSSKGLLAVRFFVHYLHHCLTWVARNHTLFFEIREGYGGEIFMVVVIHQ